MTLMTRKEAAARLGLSGPIQRKPGSKVWITEEAIAEYLARATHQARPELRTSRTAYRRRA